jgi:hypothetical protein
MNSELIPVLERIIRDAQTVLATMTADTKPPISRPAYEQYGWGITVSHKMTSAVTRVVVHHEGSPSAAGSSALAIHKYHRSLGWAAIGYHFAIERDGTINEGRPLWAVGAHAKNFNDGSWGVCLIGNLDIEPPTAAQVASLTRLLQWLLAQKRELEIVGHGELMATACPGKYLNLDAIKSNLY